MSMGWNIHILIFIFYVAIPLNISLNKILNLQKLYSWKAKEKLYLIV